VPGRHRICRQVSHSHPWACLVHVRRCSRALRWRRGIVAGGCAEHGEPCDGTSGACWQQHLWELRQAAAPAA